MYSRGHTFLSAVFGIPLAVGASGVPASAGLREYVFLLAVGIDLDHFVVGRINRGDWTNTRRCFRNPAQIFLYQSTIFDSGDI